MKKKECEKTSGYPENSGEKLSEKHGPWSRPVFIRIESNLLRPVYFSLAVSGGKYMPNKYKNMQHYRMSGRLNEGNLGFVERY